MMRETTLRICEKGHRYYKKTDCNTCPKCEQEKKPVEGFLARLSSPARSALIHEGITTLEQLAQHTEKDILKLHGIGRASIPTMKAALEEKGLSFK
ncbi:RNA polymerase alpha subunit C-terminal domain-containing protein [Metasolibacillus meyeri]|uniref:RNA polymerase alpha subunit C-terminal domain-containing protein n=1 Tax=Metasolibacillus meyeri TaxID=1071052 RepID=UPI00187D3888|nr:RNA polymerase alpha subunit C-terminal domain-containing protein [Metasolibacillus meyeri]